MFIYLMVVVFIFSISTTATSVSGATKRPTITELQKKIAVLTMQVKELTTKLNLKTKESDKLKKENASPKLLLEVILRVRKEHFLKG
jgi:hypothetical protein